MEEKLHVEQCGVIIEKVPQDRTSSPAPPQAAGILYSDVSTRKESPDCVFFGKQSLRSPWLRVYVNRDECPLGKIFRNERESMDHLLCLLLNEKALLRMSKVLPERESSESFSLFFFCL